MAPALRSHLLSDRAAWKRIGAITAAFVVLGLAYAFLATKWYRSLLTVVPAKQQRAAGLSSLLGGDLGGLAAGLDSAVSGAEVPRIAAVLQSIAVTDAVIEKFDLRTRYDEKYLERARDELWRRCKVKTLTKPGLVQLTCEDKDPRFVQELLTYYAEYGNQVFRRVSVSSASEEVRFLERRVSDLRQQATESAARMRAFQEEHQIVDLETQSRAVVSALAGLNSQRVSKQLALDYARTFSASDEANLQQLRSELGVLERKLRDLEQPDDEPPPGGAGAKAPAPGRDRGVFPAALAIPKLRAEYEALYRDRKVAEAMLIVALERLETARANEARDVSTFQVLDPPALPTRHSWPKRGVTVAVALLVGLGAGILREWVGLAGGLHAVLAGVAATPPSRRSAVDL